MAKETKIEWATATWNPWIGCTKVSPACDNCYGERWAKRCGRDFSKVTRAADATFYAPLKWKEPQRIFVCSLSDFFHANVPMGWFQEAITVMKTCPEHTFMLLTKRPENIVNRLLASNLSLPANIWLGVTVENQEQAYNRIPELLKMPAAVHFVSCEPLLGPVDLAPYLFDPSLGHFGCIIDPNQPGGAKYYQPPGISWVICGGESGPHARPMHPDWARSLRDQCAATHVPFMFKQWGEWGISELTGGFIRLGKKKTGRLLDGVEHNGMPEVRP